MELSGEHRLPLPRERVWAMLNDLDVLRTCIPGCNELQAAEDGTLKAKVTTKVGPVKATFSGEVTFKDVVEPERYTIEGAGSGGVAGFARGGADVTLTEDDDGTVLRYLARAQVGGKLAQLGSRLVDSTARKLSEQFFSQFAALAVAGHAAPPEVAIDAPVGPVEANPLAATTSSPSVGA